MPCEPWRIVSDPIQKTADACLEPVRLFPNYKNALRLGPLLADWSGMAIHISFAACFFTKITPSQRYHVLLFVLDVDDE
jgi:hypothetical protein